MTGRNNLPGPARDYRERIRRANQAAGIVIALVALIAFFVVVWPPGALLVVAAGGIAWTWDWQ